MTVLSAQRVADDRLSGLTGAAGLVAWGKSGDGQVVRGRGQTGQVGLGPRVNLTLQGGALLGLWGKNILLRVEWRVSCGVRPEAERVVRRLMGGFGLEVMVPKWWSSA